MPTRKAFVCCLLFQVYFVRHQHELRQVNDANNWNCLLVSIPRHAMPERNIRSLWRDGRVVSNPVKSTYRQARHDVTKRILLIYWTMSTSDLYDTFLDLLLIRMSNVSRSIEEDLVIGDC
jgi:hypothetical protein